MFQELKSIIGKELSGRQAFRYADRIAQFHRIQASPGYRDAATEIMKWLKRDGVEAELVPYPATFGDRFISHRSFKEWKCNSAELWIESPELKRIARFEEEEISLVQRSISTPKEGITAELVILENAEDENSYKEKDVKGKLVLVKGNPFLIHALAVEKYGAVGLIFENLNEYPPIRTVMDLPDTRQYTSFWWHSEKELKSFGFVVSPRIAKELKEMVKISTVQLKAHVDAELFEGHYENIEYFIPGKKKEEILLVSHLCHPYPGGQDNASGPGTLMEVMRTLTRLINQGNIPQPELGIRFLMMPEMTGTCAYFEQHPDRISYTIAALNLDMVGADQTKGGGPLCIEQPPLATATFVDKYLYKLVKDLSTNTKNFTGTAVYSTVHTVKNRFSGGSDHYIISDPTIGIPCPMLIQWPDRHYHTTSDTTGNLDENMMKLVGEVTALYSYGLANGTEEDWITYLMSHQQISLKELLDSKEWFMNQPFSSEETKLAFTLFYDTEVDSFKKIKKYAQLRGFNRLQELTDEYCGLFEKNINYLHELVEKEITILEKEELQQETSSDQWLNEVYERSFKGPISIFDDMKELSVEERVEWQAKYESQVPYGYSSFLCYWMDGKRTGENVLLLTKLETGQYYPEYAKEFMKKCLQLGLIRKVE